MCFLNAYANAFVCSVIGENSNLLRWPCRKGSEFKFQQIEPKSTRTYNLEGEIYLCITGVWCRFVVKHCARKPILKALRCFQPDPRNWTPRRRRFEFDCYSFDMSSPLVHGPVFDCTLFACSLVSRAHELMYSESNHCGALLYVNRRPWRR